MSPPNTITTHDHGRYGRRHHHCRRRHHYYYHHPQNHASTLEVLPDGSLVAAWFSGEKEEASGCAIVFAKLPAGTSTWSTAATLSKRDGFSNQNPVLFYDNTTSVLHLFHSQVSGGSGGGGVVCVCVCVRARARGGGFLCNRIFYVAFMIIPVMRLHLQRFNAFPSIQKCDDGWPAQLSSPFNLCCTYGL
jgi:hypothetical protein